MKYFVFLLPLFFVFGCTVNNKFQIYYQSISKPSAFFSKKNIEPKVIETTDIDVKTDFYKAQGYQVLGISNFGGSWETRAKAAEFAKSIGANLVITSAKYVNDVSEVDQIHVPTVNSSFESGEIDLGYGDIAVFTATTTTHGTQQVAIVYSIGQYEQSAVFLVKEPFHTSEQNNE